MAYSKNSDALKYRISGSSCNSEISLEILVFVEFGRKFVLDTDKMNVRWEKCVEELGAFKTDIVWKMSIYIILHHLENLLDVTSLSSSESKFLYDFKGCL